MSTDLGKSEIIVFNGVTYRRYPKSLVFSIRNYYTPNGRYRKLVMVDYIKKYGKQRTDLYQPAMRFII